jgi:hypothetical protein
MRAYVQDGDRDVYTRFAFNIDGKPMESPNPGRYGYPEYHMNSVAIRAKDGFLLVPNYSRNDMKQL